MRAIVIHAPHDLRVETTAEPGLPGPGQVSVRLGTGGICGSDLHYFHHGGFGTVRIKEPMQRNAARRILLVVYTSFTVGCALVPSRTLAHSWYPPQCCNENDCRQVDRIDDLSNGDVVMHFGGQEVLVPRSFEKQPSRDHNAHVCVYRTISGRWAPRCVFLPGLV